MAESSAAASRSARDVNGPITPDLLIRRSLASSRTEMLSRPSAEARLTAACTMRALVRAASSAELRGDIPQTIADYRPPSLGPGSMNAIPQKLLFRSGCAANAVHLQYE